MILSHIVAASQNNTIGVDGTLPWDIPEDMKFFKEKTKGHIIIMGRKTYESLGKPLPHRLNIVITRQSNFQAPEGVIVVKNIEEAIAASRKNLKTYPEEVFIIGGGEIYSQSMDIVNKIYLTRIYKNVEGDAKYPEVDKNIFLLQNQNDRTDPVKFSFLEYKRK